MENIINGKTLTFKVPSGFEVTIREQNGDDDDIISKLKNNNDGSSINRFVASIILSTSISDKKPTHNDILKWKNRDKYYVMFKSRIFSLGDLVKFTHTCSKPTCGKSQEFEEDLKPFDRDFSKPKEETDNGFKYQVKPYAHGELLERELLLSSKQKVKYKFLNGISEKKLLEYKKEEISKNTELTVRDIEWWYNERWQPLQKFDVLSARDMMEIRADLKLHDEPFEAISECTCPYCENVDYISLMAQPNFFFPQEI